MKATPWSTPWNKLKIWPIFTHPFFLFAPFPLPRLSLGTFSPFSRPRKALCSGEQRPQHRAWRGAAWGWTSPQSSGRKFLPEICVKKKVRNWLKWPKSDSEMKQFMQSCLKFQSRPSELISPQKKEGLVGGSLEKINPGGGSWTFFNLGPLQFRASGDGGIIFQQRVVKLAGNPSSSKDFRTATAFSRVFWSIWVRNTFWRHDTPFSDANVMKQKTS